MTQIEYFSKCFGWRASFGLYPDHGSKHPLRSLVLGYCWYSAAEIPLIIFPVDVSRSSSFLLPPWITRRVGKHTNTCGVGSVSGSDIFVHQFQTGKSRLCPRTRQGLATTSISSSRGPPLKKKSSPTPSVHESSGSSASYVESASGSESDNDLVDPANLLSSLPAKSPKDAKAKKCSVDEEAAAPPPKKAHRSGNKGSAASAVPSLSEPLSGPRHPSGASSSAAVSRPKTRVVDLETIEIEESLLLNDSFDFEVHCTSVDGISRMYEFYTQDAEEIRKEYKRVEARDPQGFLRMVEYFSREGFALSRTEEWLHSLRETIGDLVSFYNCVLLVYVTFQYWYSTVELLAPLPSDPEDPIFLDARDPQPRWRQYTRNTFPPFDAEPHVSMDAYENVWSSYKLALARHEASKSEKETAFLEKQRAKFSDWRERTCAYREKIPTIHQHQSDRVLGSHPRPRISSSCGKAMSTEPEIAVLDGGSVSGSDDQLLSVLRKSKGKKESKEKSRAGLEDEAEAEPEIITCTVKVKKGKRQSAVELTGPWNDLPGCIRCLLADNECVRPRYGDETPTAACTHCHTDNATCELSPIAFDWEMTDAALPDVNAEWMELQLMLMLEVPDEVGGVGTAERLLTRFLRHLRSSGTDQDVLEARCAIFGSENSSVAGGKSRPRAHPSFREEGDSNSSDSGMEVEGGKGGGDGDVSMGQEKGAKPNEMSKGVAGNGESLEEGELDAEGEIVVRTSTGEMSGAGADVNMD
ncbi:hypothetical protein B0H13DRAFT_1890139 [Mycena leptocephala]|nr:hypothetical protein B0H13DRAFT_1890139 [Mycena leptocephala]